MSKNKSGGAAKRVVKIEGKRLGFKIFGGQFVKAGGIIVRQRGSKFHPGKNVDMGKDFTIFATSTGTVSFRNMTGYKRGQQLIDVLPIE